MTHNNNTAAADTKLATIDDCGAEVMRLSASEADRLFFASADSAVTAATLASDGVNRSTPRPLLRRQRHVFYAAAAARLLLLVQ